MVQRVRSKVHGSAKVAIILHSKSALAKGMLLERLHINKLEQGADINK